MGVLFAKQESVSHSAPVSYRAFSVLTYILCIIVNAISNIAGPHTVAAVSDKYNLWVTPPPFIFSIWGLIYTLVTVILYQACTKNTWSPKTHIFFALVNFANAGWIYMWCQGTQESMVPSLGIIACIVVFLFLWWKSMYSPSQTDSTYFFHRNTVALYLGWLVGATMINLGIVIVHVLGKLSQKQFARVFFIAIPLILVVAQVYIRLTEGAHGTRSSWAMVCSVLWALAGAWMTASEHRSNIFDKGLFDL